MHTCIDLCALSAYAASACGLNCIIATTLVFTLSPHCYVWCAISAKIRVSVCMCNEGVFRMYEGDFNTPKYDPGSGEGDPRHTECGCGSYESDPMQTH